MVPKWPLVFDIAWRKKCVFLLQETHSVHNVPDWYKECKIQVVLSHISTVSGVVGLRLDCFYCTVFIYRIFGSDGSMSRQKLIFCVSIIHSMSRTTPADLVKSWGARSWTWIYWVHPQKIKNLKWPAGYQSERCTGTVTGSKHCGDERLGLEKPHAQRKTIYCLLSDTSRHWLNLASSESMSLVFIHSWTKLSTSRGKNFIEFCGGLL